MTLPFKLVFLLLVIAITWIQCQNHGVQLRLTKKGMAYGKFINSIYFLDVVFLVENRRAMTMNNIIPKRGYKNIGIITVKTFLFQIHIIHVFFYYKKPVKGPSTESFLKFS